MSDKPHPLGDPDYEPSDRRLERLWTGDTPTEPMPIVERLRHTPYRIPRPAEELAAAAEYQAALDAIDIALRLGELMLRSGAAAAKVEASVIAVGAAAGLQRLDLDITLQSMHLQCVLPDGRTITRLRVVQGARQDFARLDAIHQLVEQVIVEEWDAESVRERLRSIQIQRRNYSDLLVLLATGVLAGAVTFMLGASPVAALVAMLAGIAVHRTTKFLGRHGYPEFYQMAFGAFIGTFIAWLGYVVGVKTPVPLSGADFAYMVAGGIIILLPGRAMAAAVEDVISGYQVTGAGRVLAVLLNTSGLIIGVGGGLAAGLAITRVLDMSFVSPDVLDLRSFASPAGAAITGAFVLGASAAVTAQSRRRLIVPIALLCVTAVVIYRGLSEWAGFGVTIATGVAAVVIGVLGRLVAERVRSNAMTIIIPATFGLLPGLAIFRALYEMVSAGPYAGSLTVQSGITTLLGAGATLLAIATGTTLGDIMMNPLGQRWNQARWDRRRRRQG
ncbi:MAG TPA: threonine/serine exporter family protein [Intrasporangiaceae bacterium]|nr:threonine/serine exporter family protein [Intrasporangiaceae bacterium]